MKIETRRLSLETVDTLEADAYLLFLPEGEGPPRGLAGLIDWRLCGGLSRCLAESFFTGRPGEQLLQATGLRLPTPRILALGLGPREDFERARLRELAARAAETAAAARLSRVACALPGDPDPPVSSSEGRRILEEAFSSAFDGTLVLLGPEGSAVPN